MIRRVINSFVLILGAIIFNFFVFRMMPGDPVSILITRATLTETVFNWYGIGRLIFDSVIAQNYPVLQAIFYIMALTLIVANFIADILYGFLDPRVRYN